MYCESTEFFFIKLHTFLLYGDIVSALGPEILIQEPAIHNLGRGPHIILMHLVVTEYISLCIDDEFLWFHIPVF